MKTLTSYINDKIDLLVKNISDTPKLGSEFGFRLGSPEELKVCCAQIENDEVFKKDLINFLNNRCREIETTQCKVDNIMATVFDKENIGMNYTLSGHSEKQALMGTSLWTEIEGVLTAHGGDIRKIRDSARSWLKNKKEKARNNTRKEEGEESTDSPSIVDMNNSYSDQPIPSISTLPPIPSIQTLNQDTHFENLNTAFQTSFQVLKAGSQQYDQNQ